MAKIKIYTKDQYGDEPSGMVDEFSVGFNEKILNASEKVISRKKIIVYFSDYFDEPREVIYHSKGGFTAGRLAKLIRSYYRKHSRSLWGHSVKDLFVEELRVNKNGVVTMHIGS